MTKLDKGLLEIREEFRHMLFQYRANKGLRMNIITSLWMINNLITLQKATKAAINKTKSQQNIKAR